MDIEDYIERIIEKGNIDDMRALSDMLEETIETLDKYDEKCSQRYEMKLYRIAYGDSLNKELAQKIVKKMHPYGEKWTLNETMDIQEQYGINHIKSNDFYVVMNSAYNDYSDIFKDNLEYYIKFTQDFINDEDATDDKVFIYFTTIPKK